MADSVVFEFVCQELEQRTSLSRLEARGTVRLGLKEAGLEAANVTVQQMMVALRTVLSRELKARRLSDPAGICDAIAERLLDLKLDSDVSQTPEAVFARLGGGA